MNDEELGAFEVQTEDPFKKIISRDERERLQSNEKDFLKELEFILKGAIDQYTAEEFSKKIQSKLTDIDGFVEEVYNEIINKTLKFNKLGEEALKFNFPSNPYSEAYTEAKEIIKKFWIMNSWQNIMFEFLKTERAKFLEIINRVKSVSSDQIKKELEIESQDKLIAFMKESNKQMQEFYKDIFEGIMKSQKIEKESKKEIIKPEPQKELPPKPKKPWIEPEEEEEE